MKRVLVVDDHGLWRRNVRALLDTDDGWEIVADVDNGLDAVAAALEKAPDLILLDIDLPLMTGLEAARRILARAPASRILFVSSHRSWDIVEAGFETGARGYVLKIHAGSELLRAMDAVLDDKWFISAAFVGCSVEAVSESRHRHSVGFYPEPTRMLEDFADFAGDALLRGSAVIAVTRADRRDDLLRRLRARIDIERALRQGRYRWMDTGTFFDAIPAQGSLDEAIFSRNAISGILQAARQSRQDPPRVVACGECAPELLRCGRPEEAIRLEQLWDDLAAAFNVDTLCGYPALSRHDSSLSAALDDICAAHTSVIAR